MHTNARTYTYCEQAWSGKRKGYGKYASNTKDANTKDARYGGKTKANTKGNLKSPAANLIGRAITSNVHMQPGGSKEASLLKATTISSFKTAYHGIEHPQCSKSIYIQPTTVSSTRVWPLVNADDCRTFRVAFSPFWPHAMFYIYLPNKSHICLGY